MHGVLALSLTLDIICVILDELHIGQNNYSLVMYTNLRQICYNEGIAKSLILDII